MRIIDKNRDYYDYLQDPTDTLVFDRRGSFILTKEIFINRLMLYTRKCHGLSEYHNILLQCGGTFWLLLITIIPDVREFGWGCYPKIRDYSFDLLATWKDYSKPNVLLNLGFCHNEEYGYGYDYKCKSYKDMKIIRKEVNPDIIVTNFKRHSRVFSDSVSLFSTYHTVNGSGERLESTIPILKDSGIASVVDPLELFCAIEEYFSIEKTSSERTEAIGVTDNDKIVMHGFDTKTSFRGKR